MLHHKRKQYRRFVKHELKMDHILGGLPLKRDSTIGEKRAKSTRHLRLYREDTKYEESEDSNLSLHLALAGLFLEEKTEEGEPPPRKRKWKTFLGCPYWVYEDAR